MKLKNHFLPLLTGFLCVAILLWQWTQFFDLDPEDESLYILNGIVNHKDATWGPIYSSYYHLISFLTPDPTQMYSVNFVLIAFGVFLALYGITSFLSNSKTTALLIALFSFCTGANLVIFPKIQLFNFCVIVFLFFVVHRRTENRWRLFLFYILISMSLFIRQDDLLYLLAILAYDLWRFRTQGLRFLSMTVGSIAFAILSTFTWLTVSIGNPFDRYRAWSAFTDHYIWRTPELAAMAPFAKSNMERAATVFGGSQSIFQAFLHSPSHFLIYAFKNFADFLPQFFDTLKILPYSPLTSTLIILFLVLLLVFFIKDDSVLPTKEKQYFVFYFIGTTFFKTLLICVLLNPDPKYLLEIVLLAPILAAGILKNLINQKWIESWPILSTPFVSGIAIVFAIVIRFEIGLPHYESGQRELNEKITAIAQSQRSQLIVCHLGLSVYLMNDFKTKASRDFVQKYANQESFGDYVLQENGDLVVINPPVMNGALQMGSGETFLHFIRDHEKWGFKQIPINIPDTFVFAKED